MLLLEAVGGGHEIAQNADFYIMLLYDIYILHMSMRQSNLNELTHINVQNRDMNWYNHLDIFFAQKKEAK